MPYIYFFVLPMSIGDCHESMGNHAAAEQSVPLQRSTTRT